MTHYRFAFLLAWFLAMSAISQANAQQSHRHNAALRSYTGIFQWNVAQLNKRAKNSFSVVTDNGTSRKIKFIRPIPSAILEGQIVSGSNIKVRGKLKGSRLIVRANSKNLLVFSTPSTAQALSGSRNVLVIPINGSDANVYCSNSMLQSAIFGATNSANALYLETSFGRVGLNGLVISPVKINAAMNGACDYTSWSSAAVTQLTSQGINLSDYQHRLFILPPTVNCPWPATANVGGPNSWFKDCTRTDLYPHELGHNLGFQHASTASYEYGDNSDFMGNPQVFRRLNAAHMAQLNWVPPSQIQSLTASGIFTLSPLDLPTEAAGGLRILKILDTTINKYLYVSYRRNTGFDSTLSTLYANHINIHSQGLSGTGYTYFLNALDDERSFSNQSGSIIIKQLSHSDQGASVEVLIKGCVPQPPTLSVAPASQNAAPGEEKTYMISVTNNDNPLCAPQTFSFQFPRISPLQGRYAISAVQLAPAQSIRTNLSVGSLTTIQEGTYNFTVGLSGSDLIHSRSFSGTQTIMSSNFFPTNFIASAAASIVYLSWDPPLGNYQVLEYRLYRDQKLIKTLSQSATSYKDSLVIPGSTYSYYVTALDETGKESAPSNTQIITVPSNTRPNY